MAERVEVNPRTAKSDEPLIAARAGKRLVLEDVAVSARKEATVTLRSSVTGDVLAVVWTRPSGGTHRHSKDIEPITPLGEGVVYSVDSGDVRIEAFYREM